MSRVGCKAVPACGERRKSWQTHTNAYSLRHRDETRRQRHRQGRALARQSQQSPAKQDQHHDVHSRARSHLPNEHHDSDELSDGQPDLNKVVQHRRTLLL